MSYAYRPTQPKPSVQSPTNSKAKESQPPRQLSKQQLKTYESLLLIIGYVLKSNQQKKIKESFTKIKTLVQKKKKYSELLAKKLHFLFKHKQKTYTQIFFSCLVANKITFYNTQMSTQKQLKQTSKTRAVGILFHSLQKLYTRKFKNAFHDLKTRSLAYNKARIFKTTHMFARLSLAYRHKLQGAFNKLAQNRVKVSRKGRVGNKLQNFFSAKNKKNIWAAFNRLRINFYRSKLNEIQAPPAEPAKLESKLSSSKNLRTSNSGISKMQSERRQMQERSRQLQAQITQLQQAAGKNLTVLRNEIARLEKENESLRFNNDLLEQNNGEMEKEIQSKQLRARKKLPKNEIWENVYNNLIYFLSLNRNKSISKEELIECLQTPLVPCNTNLQELREQNKVLSQLLEEYRKSFPQPETNESQVQVKLPYDLLKRKNRYYYQVLEVLAEWGLSGSNELEQLNSDLELLQRKLVE